MLKTSLVLLVFKYIKKQANGFDSLAFCGSQVETLNLKALRELSFEKH